MGCTGSKSLAMQARLENWEDSSVKSTKSFVRSLSMPLRKPQLHYSGSSFSSTSMVSGDGAADEYRNFSGSLQLHSGSLNNDNHSASLHTVQLMSTTYGALKMSDEQRPEEADERRLLAAPPATATATATATGTSLAKIPEAEVIDVEKLMRELDEEAAAPRRRRRRQRQQRSLAAQWRQQQQRQGEAGAMVFGRSISSVASARELDAKIRAIVLALPNSRKKLRALESLQSIVFCDDDDDDDDGDDGDEDELGDSGSDGDKRSSSLQSRSMKGLFYGTRLEELSPSPSPSCPLSPPLRPPTPLSLSLSPLHEKARQLPGDSCVLPPVSTSTSSSGPSSSSSEEDPLFFDPGSGVESFHQGAELADQAASPAAAQDAKYVSQESLASAAATVRAKRMQSSKVCSLEVEEQRRIPPGGENRVVLYVTSLRGVRKTFEDCNLVRGIVRGFGVAIDERDVSMHAEFRNELRTLMEAWCGVGSSTVVPRLFVKGHYIGGAEDVVALNEEGAIAGWLEGVPRMDGPDEVCGGCGSIRFVPCGDCCGSTKLVQVDGGEFTRCSTCNENGLVRCPVCL